MSVSTDHSFSITAKEFVWADKDMPPAHDYLVPPTIEALRDASAKSVLDLGCGNGAFCARLHSEGFLVVGCDASASGLVFARRAHPAIKFIQHDISHTLPDVLSGLYDAVVSLEVVEHLFQPRHLVSAAFHALHPGGVFVMSTPFHGYWKNLALALTNSFDAHWHPLRDFGHIKFFSRKTLMQLLEEGGFVVKNFLRVGRIPGFACSMIAVAIKP